MSRQDVLYGEMRNERDAMQEHMEKFFQLSFKLGFDVPSVLDDLADAMYDVTGITAEIVQAEG